MPPIQIGRHHWKGKRYVIGPSDRQDHREPAAELLDVDLWKLEPDELPDGPNAEIERRIRILRAKKQEVGRSLRPAELAELDKPVRSRRKA